MKVAARLFLAAAATAMLGITLPATAQDPGFPPRRPGLWEVTTVTEKPEKVPKISARMCVDAATDRELMDFGLRFSKDSCKRYEVRRSGQSWTIESQCDLGPVKSTSKARVSGDFNARVTVRVEGTAEGLPGSSGPQRTLMTQEARWVADVCEGMKPGDIVMDGGIKLNVKQIKQMQKLLPGLIR